MNYLKIINKSYYPKKSFIYKNGINKNGFENIKADTEGYETPKSYLKVKSGIFSSKVQVDSLLAENNKSKDLNKKLNDSLGTHIGCKASFQIKENIIHTY